MPSRAEHSWKKKTQDGIWREVRATRFGGRWRIQSKLRTDELWTYHDRPAREDLEMLLDVLQRKYQRRRVSHDDVTSVELLLKHNERQK